MIFFLILINFIFLNNSWAIEVCPQCEFKSISKAIAQAIPGSVITVKSGVYKEGRIVIDKKLTLKGEGNPVLDGENQHQIITVKKANGVSISGFTIQNTGLSYTEELAGIKVIESKDCEIEMNHFLNTTYGIYLENSEKCHLKENEFQGQAINESSAGNAIHIWYGFQHLVEKNRIYGHRDGIYLEFTKGTQIQDNDVRRNIRYGLHFMSSNQTSYYRNFFSENGAGAAVMYSRDIRMMENHFVKNTGPASYGVLLKEVYSSEIHRNFFEDNTIAIYMEGSNRSNFTNNHLSKNGWGLRIMGNCENNVFSKNNFIYNTFDVATNTDHSWNTFKENYWSQYDGYDLNHDGIGDRPYRPVSLSSIMIEQLDSSYILINSFFFTVMDQVERALPSLIPEPLKDEFPLMTIVKIEL